jgi:hypothetical protein
MIEKLDSLSSITSIIQVVLGGFVFSVLKFWLLREDEVDKAIGLQKEKMYEEVCDSMQNVIQRAFDDDIALRGNGGEHPDVIYSYAKKVVGVCSEFDNLKHSKNLINNLNTFLIITSLLGVVFFLVAHCISSHFYVISIAALITILCQIVAFMVIRFEGIKLNKFENL